MQENVKNAEQLNFHRILLATAVDTMKQNGRHCPEKVN